MDNKRSRDADFEATSASGKRVRLERAASPVGPDTIKSVAHQALFRSYSQNSQTSQSNDNRVGDRRGNFTSINSIISLEPDSAPALAFDPQSANTHRSDSNGNVPGRTSETSAADFSSKDGTDTGIVEAASNSSFLPIDRTPPEALIDITRRFHQAVSSGQHHQSPTYVDADVMIIYWAEDYDEVKASIKLLGSVFQHSFYYATEVFPIPSTDSEQALYAAVDDFFGKNSTPEKLAILYYAGRSVPSEPSGGAPMWLPQREDSDLFIRYKPIEAAYRKSLCDVLLLLDHCSIRHPHYTKKPNGTARRKVVEVVDAPPAEPGQTQVSFSEALAKELVAIAHGEPLSVETLHKQIVSRMAIPKVRGRGRPPKEPIVKPLADPHLPNHYFLQECRSIVLAPIPDVPQVVLCIRVLKNVKDISRWGQWILDADARARDAVQFEGLSSGDSTMLVLRVPVKEWDCFRECPVGSLVGYTTIGDISPEVLEKIDADLSAKLWIDDSPPPLAASSTVDGPTASHDLSTSVSPSPAAILQEAAISGTAHGDASRKRPRKALPTERKLLPSSQGSLTSPIRVIEQATASRDRPVYRQLLDQQQRQQQQQQEQQRLSQQGLSRQLVENGFSEREALLVAAAQKPVKISIKLAGQNHMCNECKTGFKDIDSLRIHVRKQHTRPFHCVFNWAGCDSTFASKNEWKRHVMSQHILLHYWVCQIELCSKIVNKAPGAAHSSFSLPDGAIFNRKDLFTQHLRRMHTPTNVKKLLKQTKQPNKAPNHPAILEWEKRMKELQQAGIRPRCRLPEFMACPSPGCGVVYHGNSAWDDRMEHVARHLEGAAAGREALVVFGGESDPTLTDWATRPEVGIAKKIGPNAWRLDNPLRPEIREWTGDGDNVDIPVPKPEPSDQALLSQEDFDLEDEQSGGRATTPPPKDTPPVEETSDNSQERSKSVIEVADPDSLMTESYSDSGPEKTAGHDGHAADDGQAAETEHTKDGEESEKHVNARTRQVTRETSSPNITVM